MRKSNIELLRILSMFFIVLGHFTGQSGMKEFYTSFDFGSYIFYFLMMGARISTLVFLFIGCWFMVDMPFKPLRVIRLYSKWWIYGFVITSILLICGVPVKIRWIIGGVFPYLTNTLWFCCQYLNLMLLSPFLKKILQWDRQVQSKLLFLLFFLILFMSTIKKFQNSFVADLLFFQFVFLFIGYYKRYVVEKIWFKRWNIVLGGAIYLVLVFLKLISESFQGGLFEISKLIVTQYLCDLKSLPAFFSAFCIFVFFKNLVFETSKFINNLAKSCFSVYIIHQHPAFYMYLWKNICCCDSWMGSNISLFIVCILALLIFLLCSAIDHMTRLYVEPIVMKSRASLWAEKKLEQFYSQV